MERITLKENCESFIKEAVSMYCRKPSTVHRKAVSLMLLVQAVELLLKQKLANHSSLLLYENVDAPKRTVSMKSCLQRLAHLDEPPAQGKDQKALERAIELLDLTIADPKNKKRLKEVLRVREALLDHFIFDNE